MRISTLLDEGLISKSNIRLGLFTESTKDQKKTGSLGGSTFCRSVTSCLKIKKEGVQSVPRARSPAG